MASEILTTKKNSLWPYIKFSGETLSNTASALFKSYKVWEKILSGDNCFLVFCGCCWVILPILTVQTVFILAILFAMFLVLSVIGLGIGLVFSLIGIWPAFVITAGVTGVSIIRIPHNFYYTFKVLYRSICITRTLKLTMAILSIPTLVLTPMFIMISVLIISLIVCFVTSFCGWVLQPWTYIEDVMKKFWKVYVTDAKAFADDYGHPTGIPNNWDGSIYGGYFNPLTITLAAILFVYGLPSMTVGTVLIISIKIIPIYIFSLINTIKRFNIVRAVKIYIDVIVGWAEVGTIKNYRDVVKSYAKCSPFKMVSDMDCCMTLILAWLVLLSLITWILIWPIVIIGPILTYIMGFIVIIIVMPLAYIGIWLCCLTFPIISCIVFACSGPFFSIRCPYVALRHNIMLPGQLSKSMKLGFSEPFHLFKYWDRQTSKISVGKFSLFKQENISEFENFASSWEAPISIWQKATDKVRKIEYWDLVQNSLRNAKDEVIELKWISKEDIESAMPNVLIAIPALAIVEVLLASIRKDINNESLIYWDNDNQCDDKSRDRRDNIISHYWPLIIDIKKDLLLLHDSDTSEMDKENEALPLVQTVSTKDTKTSKENVSDDNTSDASSKKKTSCCWSFFCKSQRIRNQPSNQFLGNFIDVTETFILKASLSMR